MSSYIKKHNIILFTQKELRDMFEISKKSEIRMKLLDTVFESTGKSIEVDRIINDMVKKLAKNRDEHEIFFAAYSVVYFYNENATIGFKMKRGFDSKKQPINLFEDLIKFREVHTDIDFIIGNGDGLRFFQLKRYTGELKSEDLISFIKKTVDGYGSLGSTNLLIIIQPCESFLTADFDVQYIHHQIKLLNYRFTGEILLKWNQMNEKSIIIQIYPELKKMSIPFILPSQRDKS